MSLQTREQMLQGYLCEIRARDSDQSPQGRDAQRLDAKHAGAVAKPIAKRLP